MPQTFKARTPANPLRCFGSRGLVERKAFGMINLTFNHLILGLARLLSGTGVFATGCPSPPVQPASRSNTIAALLGEWDRGRQVTNLNGARILGVVQQPDGAAVFPFKIPDAATHESAQHLFQKKKKALLPCVFRTRTIKLNGNVQVNVTLTAMAGPLRDQKQRIEPPQRAPLSSR